VSEIYDRIGLPPRGQVQRVENWGSWNPLADLRGTLRRERVPPRIGQRYSADFGSIFRAAEAYEGRDLVARWGGDAAERPALPLSYDGDVDETESSVWGQADAPDV